MFRFDATVEIWCDRCKCEPAIQYGEEAVVVMTMETRRKLSDPPQLGHYHRECYVQVADSIGEHTHAMFDACYPDLGK